jgi:hypothetical protein
MRWSWLMPLAGSLATALATGKSANPPRD